MGRRLVIIPLAALLLAGCAKTHQMGFPRPVRAPVLVPSDFETTMSKLTGWLEGKGIPVLMTDRQFGTIQTDWVYWKPGDVDLSAVANCGTGAHTPPDRTRARFRFDIRRRANHSTVQIVAQWQVERHPGFAGGTAGFVDCHSTGEWERAVEESLTQRQTIR